MHEPDYKNLIAFLKAMEFKTLTRRVADKAGVDAAQVEADAKATSGRPSPARREGGAAPAAPVGSAATCSRSPPPAALPQARRGRNAQRAER